MTLLRETDDRAPRRVALRRQPTVLICVRARHSAEQQQRRREFRH